MTSKALGNAFNLRDVVNPKNPTYGAKDDGSTDATAGIQAAFDSQVASVGKVVIPGRLAGAGNFLISGTIDYDNPSFSLVDMQGAKVTASHDGIAFNLNPAADPSAPNSTLQSQIRWVGGYLVGTAAAPAASEGIRCYGVRNLKISDMRINGFKYGIRMDGLDTLRVKDVHFFNDDIGIDIPQWQTVAPNLAHIDTVIEDCHFSCSGNTSGVRVREFFINFTIRGGSFNGAWSGPAIDIQDYNPNDAGALRCINILGVHFEQGAADERYILLDDANARGFTGVNIKDGNAFGDSNAGFVSIELQRSSNVDIRGNTFGQTGVAITGNGTTNGINVTSGSAVVTFSGTANTTGLVAGMYVTAPGVPYGAKVLTNDGAAQVTLDTNADQSFTFTSATFNVATPILLDANCTNVRIGPNFFSTGKVIYLCARNQVTFEPEYRSIGSAYPITGFDGAAFSSASATYIDMRVAIAALWPTQGVPKAYAINISANDSGSAGSTTAEVQVLTPGDTQARNLRLNVAGVPNDKVVGVGGIVHADKYGNLTYRVVASGVGTMDIRIAITGIFM